MLRDDVDVTGRFVKRLARSQPHRFLASILARVADLTALPQMPTILWHIDSEQLYVIDADARQHIHTLQEEERHDHAHHLGQAQSWHLGRV
jgi:hypothetical protein